MVRSNESLPKQGIAERTSRFLRNCNALGAAALAGLAIIAPPVVAPALGLWAGVNAAQAGGFELARRHFANKKPH